MVILLLQSANKKVILFISLAFGVLGGVGIFITLHNYSTITKIIIALIFIIVILIGSIIVYILELYKIISKYDNLQEKYNDLNKNHTALSSLYDEKVQIIERYKNELSILNLLFYQIISVTSNEDVRNRISSLHSAVINVEQIVHKGDQNDSSNKGN